MIYLTQMIFVEEGKAKIFHEFEALAIPLMSKYGGKLIFRLRPDEDNFIENNWEENPDEIHFISFPSKQQLNQFLTDPARQKTLHLKEASVRSTFTVLGDKI